MDEQYMEILRICFESKYLKGKQISEEEKELRWQSFLDGFKFCLQLYGKE